VAPVDRLLGRLLPALIIAAGVTLVAAGLLSYTAAPTTGGAPSPTPEATAASPSPTPVARATPSVRPPASQPVVRSPDPRAVASRVLVPALRIDLPVISGRVDPPGNPGNYPLCDVAQYLHEYSQPGQEGTTYLYAHARAGMFLPLLQESERNDGARMIGALVQVYTSDGWLYLYEIFRVKRHATDFRLADDLRPGEQRLILQTSEGPKGTVPKLQVAARLLSSQPGDPRQARPPAKPRICA
jgi:hypothetical protein